ncbi:MAG: M48 family metalloprotease [bacterium]|nr:M48 family metalloprotease [bacterium]
MKRQRLLTIIVILATVGAVYWLVGCASVANFATEVAQATGNISEEEADSLHKSIDAIDLTFKGISPQQEYYIGRAVAARLLSDYPPLKDHERNRYLNQLGQTLAMASDRPETFSGYHFLMIDTDEINAFAAPGGLILISRGMVDLCNSEDELAAVLAHEISHVVQKHGLKAIKKSRLTSALTILATEGARTFGGSDLKQLVTDYEGSIDDITSTLVISGYSRGQEEEADRTAIVIMERVGYDPKALTRMLAEMKNRIHSDGPGFAKTHPDPQDRIDSIRPALAGKFSQNEPAVRHDRFVAAMR